MPFSNQAGNPLRWSQSAARVPHPDDLSAMLETAARNFRGMPDPPVVAHSLDHAVVEIVRGHQVICRPPIYDQLRAMGDRGIEARYEQIRTLLRERLDEE